MEPTNEDKNIKDIEDSENIPQSSTNVDTNLFFSSEYINSCANLFQEYQYQSDRDHFLHQPFPTETENADDELDDHFFLNIPEPPTTNTTEIASSNATNSPTLHKIEPTVEIPNKFARLGSTHSSSNISDLSSSSQPRKLSANMSSSSQTGKRKEKPSNNEELPVKRKVIIDLGHSSQAFSLDKTETSGNTIKAFSTIRMFFYSVHIFHFTVEFNRFKLENVAMVSLPF